MTRRAQPRRGILLLELTILIGLMFAVIWILFDVMNDGMLFSRLTREHANRVAAMDSITRALNADAINASAFRWNGSTLTLDPSGASQRTEYVFAAGSVTRRVGGADASVWSAKRLGFAVRVEPGPRAVVLHVDFIEQPPAKATPLPDRTYAFSVLLPGESAAHASEPETQP